MHSTTYRFTLQTSYAHSLITRTNKPTLIALTLQTVPSLSYVSPTVSKLVLTVTVISLNTKRIVLR
jgi:hypothetical protein